MKYVSYVSFTLFLSVGKVETKTLAQVSSKGRAVV
jgi:hypothetical protein